MTLKKLTMILLSAGALSFGAYAAHAGNNQHGTPEEMSQKRLDHLKSALNLTEVQVYKIKTIYMQNGPKFQADHDQLKISTTDAQKKSAREKVKSDVEQQQAQISELLTPDQQKKFTAMIAKEAKHWKGDEGSQAPPEQK